MAPFYGGCLSRGSLRGSEYAPALVGVNFVRLQSAPRRYLRRACVAGGLSGPQGLSSSPTTGKAFVSSAGEFSDAIRGRIRRSRARDGRRSVCCPLEASIGGGAGPGGEVAAVMEVGDVADVGEDPGCADQADVVDVHQVRAASLDPAASALADSDPVCAYQPR